MTRTTDSSNDGLPAEPPVDPYDQVPWATHAIPSTRPEHLAALSWLAGGPRPPLHGCRILEVGCADGANLVPLAFYRPHATALGVDTSRVQIEAARAAVREVGLDNIVFERTDLRDLSRRDGVSFDFIIAHGVLSWVAPDVREALFELCRRLLAPSGVAFVSHNVHPGWKVRGLVRELMLHQFGSVADPEDRTRRVQQRALEYRDLLTPRTGHPYCELLRGELELLAATPPSHVTHDHLEAHNHPFWITEVLDLAAKHGLSYLADARFQPDDLARLREVRAALAAQGFTGADLELYLDLLTNRQLRASILCRAEDSGQRPPNVAALEAEELLVEAGLHGEVEGGRLDLALRGPPVPPPVGTTAHALARLEARRGALLTTPFHTHYRLDDLERFLVPRLDGAHDRAAIIEELLAKARAGELRVEVEGQQIAEETEVARVLDGLYEETLASLLRAGLLEPIWECRRAVTP